MVKPLDVACHRQCDEEGSNQRPRCQCRYRDSGEWSSHAALLSCVRSRGDLSPFVAGSQDTMVGAVGVDEVRHDFLFRG